jgi:hypothetical protein
VDLTITKMDVSQVTQLGILVAGTYQQYAETLVEGTFPIYGSLSDAAGNTHFQVASIQVTAP